MRSTRRAFLGAPLSLIPLYRRPQAAEPPPKPPRPTFSPAALVADLRAYFALVEEATPEPYLFTSRAAVKDKLADLEGWIRGPMSRRAFLPILRQLSAAYRIGHHFVERDVELDAHRGAGGRLWPVSVRLDETGALRVARANPDVPALAVDDEIVAINGRPTRVLVGNVMAGIPAETPAVQRLTLEHHFAAFVWEQGLDSPFTIEARHGRETVAFPWDGAAAGARPPRIFGGPRTVDVGFSGRVLDGGIAYVDYRSMDGQHETAWTAFLRTTFEDLRRAKRRGLVVDLRQNGGGNSSLGLPLLDLIARRPYRLAAEKRWRHSHAYERAWKRMSAQRPDLEPWAKTRLAAVPVGQVWRSAFEMREPPVDPLHFAGPVVCLTGPGTFSSAMMLADGVKTYELARVVGEPTGGVPTSHGEIGYTALPHTQIEVSFCSALYVRASGDTKDTGPVVPDQLVAPVAGRDAALAEACAWINAQTS